MTKLDAEGNGEYEKQLSLADLGGNVPDDIARALTEDKQVRNVGRITVAGATPSYSVRRQPLVTTIGEKVAITKPMLAKYLLVRKTYATMIVDRYRVQNGYVPLVCYGGEQNEFKASFDELYPGATFPAHLKDIAQRPSGSH